jgi:hypothetical protein
MREDARVLALRIQHARHRGVVVSQPNEDNASVRLGAEWAAVNAAGVPSASRWAISLR